MAVQSEQFNSNSQTVTECWQHPISKYNQNKPPKYRNLNAVATILVRIFCLLKNYEGFHWTGKTLGSSQISKTELFVFICAISHFLPHTRQPEICDLMSLLLLLQIFMLKYKNSNILEKFP